MYGAFFRGTAFPNQTSPLRAAKLWCFCVDTMLTLVNVRHNGVWLLWKPPPWGGVKNTVGWMACALWEVVDL